MRCRQGQASGIWHSTHPTSHIRELDFSPGSPAPTRLPVTVHPGKAAHRGSRTWVSAARTGHLDWILASWLQLSSAMAIAGQLCSEPPDEQSCVCVCLCVLSKTMKIKKIFSQVRAQSSVKANWQSGGFSGEIIHDSQISKNRDLVVNN